jgi:hypothetical protein
MAIKHDYTFICEYARMELGGKYVVIGLFPNGITTPTLPLSLPSLTFYQALTADSTGKVKFTAALSHRETGRMLAQVQGEIQIHMPGPAVVPIALANVQFKEHGQYSWTLRIEGQAESFITTFQVSPMQPNPGRPVTAVGRA